MDILFAVHQFFPKFYTGTEQVVLNLAKQMQKMGHRARVLTYEFEDKEDLVPKEDLLVRKYLYQGIEVTAIRYRSHPEDLDFWINRDDMEKALLDLLDEMDCDLVHVCHPMRMGSIIGAAGKKGIPVVMTLTDFWLICPKFVAVTINNKLCNGPEAGLKCAKDCYDDLWAQRLKDRFKEIVQTVKEVDCIVSPTKFLGDAIKRELHVEIRVIPFGQEYGSFRPNVRSYSSDSRITIGFLSTLVPHKGAYILIDAFNRLDTNNMQLRIYGDHLGNKDYFEALENMVVDPDKVQFCGRYKESDLPTILQEIDVVAVPSLWWENSPLVLLRALAHRVPPIISNMGGMTELVEDGASGFTFEAADPESLAGILKKISSEPTILNGMKNEIRLPPRIEEEAFEYEKLYIDVARKGL
jgi:glycosyltransferase involved in cell wall biosynthesis